LILPPPSGAIIASAGPRPAPLVVEGLSSWARAPKASQRAEVPRYVKDACKKTVISIDVVPLLILTGCRLSEILPTVAGSAGRTKHSLLALPAAALTVEPQRRKTLRAHLRSMVSARGRVPAEPAT
jgi:hypothetical protein